MRISLFNAWFLSAPMIIIFAYVSVFHTATAKRMGDMTGYTPKEKAATVLASLSPYPFMALTVFTPISSNKAAIVIGALLYAIGLTGFLFAVVNYAKSLPGKPAMQGIYKISRNPMYVSALLIFASIVIVTLNVSLMILLIIIIGLHHGMIRAEENACTRRFAEAYELYTKSTPRYLFI